jgi:hypothetical protein
VQIKLFNFLKEWFKKPLPIIKKEEEVKLLIPNYVRKLEDRFNVSLEDSYIELVQQGITGKQIVGKTLYLHAKSLRK